MKVNATDCRGIELRLIPFFATIVATLPAYLMHKELGYIGARRRGKVPVKKKLAW